MVFKIIYLFFPKKKSETKLKNLDIILFPSKSSETFPYIF